MFRICSMVFAGGLMASGASGATFDVMFNSFVPGNFIETPTRKSGNLTLNNNQNTATFDYAGSVNITTGELKGRVETQGATNRFGDSISTVTTLSETVSVSGTGSVTFFIGYDGMWDVAAQSDLPALFDVTTNLVLNPGQNGQLGGAQSAFANVANNRDNPLVGSTAGQISATIDVSGSGSFEVSSALVVSMGRGNGFVDFSNTATLGFSTTGDVALSFADPNFLSSATSPTAEPTPVPLPAGFALLLSGLAWFKFVGRKERRAA